jgi:hypothetical protein
MGMIINVFNSCCAYTYTNLNPKAERWDRDHLHKASAVLVCCVVGNTCCPPHNAHDMDLWIDSDQNRMSAVECEEQRNSRRQSVHYSSET